MAVEVVGRDEELSSLYAFLDRRVAAAGPIALALEGEAGIGKSTLWRAAVEVARGRGLRVLSSRPTESEHGLAHAGLGDLFDGVSRRRPAGPDGAAASGTRGRAPRRGRGGSSGRPAGSRGCRSQRPGAARRGRARRRDRRPPVARRLVRERARVRTSSAARGEHAAGLDPSARRTGEQPSAVENALDPDRIDRVRVGPLSVGAIHRLVRGRLSRTVARPTLLRLHEVSGGNPVLRARARAGARCGGRGSRSDAAAAGSRAAGGARLRPARRLHRRDA